MIAPVAFFAGVTLLVLIVQGSLGDNESGSPAATATAEPAGAVEEAAPAEEAAPPGEAAPAAEASGTGEAGTEGSGANATEPESEKQFYRVQSGDTLESIANRFDTTVAALLELNPDIDPLALRPGQRIRIS